MPTPFKINSIAPKKIFSFGFALALLTQIPTYAQSNSNAGQLEPVKTIASLDVSRYLGTWYEIAKFPNWFQKKCVGNTKAMYSLKDGDGVRVLNSCKTANGDIAQAEGLARQIGAADSPKLEVRFAPAWLSFLPFVWGDYWVIDLDSQYEVAAVSDSKREYLWILSRNPRLDQKKYDDLVGRLQGQGFDTRNLEITNQSQ